MPSTDTLYWIQKQSGGPAEPARYTSNGQWQTLGAAAALSPNWTGDVLSPPTPPAPPPAPTPTATPIYDFGDYRDTRGRVAVNPAIFTQPGTMILGADGQSMWGNYGQLSGWDPSGEIYELNVWDGKIYKVDSNVIMGSDGWSGRSSILPYLAANLLWQGKAARVLICAAIKGGTTAAEWRGDNPQDGRVHTALCDRRKVIIERLAALSLKPHRWCSVQGQADVQAQTDFYNGYSVDRCTGVQVVRALVPSCQCYIGQGVYWNNVSNVYTQQAANIRQGQYIASVWAGAILGPDDDVYSAAQYRVDGVHWSDVGRYYTVQAWASAIAGV